MANTLTLELKEKIDSTNAEAIGEELFAAVAKEPCDALFTSSQLRSPFHYAIR
jgi:hypothetical protein